MAFDRQKYIDVVNNGVGIMAKGPYPPALPGYNLNLQGLAYDPAQARQLLAESKYGGPQGLPPIVFTDAGIGNTAGASVAAMAQMWQQNLGVTITIENLEPDKYYDLLYSGQHGQLFSGGWCADYPDPENFADVLFHTGAQQNTGNYSNPALDAILDQARLEQERDQAHPTLPTGRANDRSRCTGAVHHARCFLRAGQVECERLRTDADHYSPGTLFIFATVR